MRQAGRYLPEYRKVRQEAGDFLSLCYNPDYATEVTLQPIRRFGFDASILFSDILVIPHAMGMGLRYAEGEGPLLSPVMKDMDDVRRLDIDNIDDRLAPVYKTVSRLRRDLPEQTALIGFAGCPWTVITYMIEGRGKTDFSACKRMMRNDRVTFDMLVDKVTQATIHYLKSQIDAGAEVIQIFDSWANVLCSDDDVFERYIIYPAMQIIRQLRECSDIPIIAFPKSIGGLYEHYIGRVQPDGVGVSHDASLDQMAQLQRMCCVQGNMSPILLRDGGVEDIRLCARRIIDAVGGGPFIFNLGHGIDKDTPIENVEALIKEVRGE